MQKHLIIPVLAAALFAPACKDQSAPSASATSASPLDAFYVAEAPGNVRQISEVFADPVPGKEVVLAGEIMGRKHPFVEGRATVMLGDPTKVTPCNRHNNDCSTPWDNCCTDSELLKKAVATIQFVDSEGKVIKGDLKGYKGIKEQSYLTVKGTIAEGSSKENLIINATAFHLTDPSPYVNAPPAADLAGPGAGTGDASSQKKNE